MEETREGRFIANDLYLSASDEGPSLLLITGPNMGGKSTYLRQAAMLVLMAQMGSFVPAQSLRLGLVDRIYTRIGASDNVARGRSTFMVEMTETATILNTATRRSLILLDEMGRGTATFDGLSLAWATVEYLHAETGARTLFATHYHELTMLAEKLPRVRNLRVGVKEGAGGIVFLHTIEPGAASKSYGIEVAKLAGLPAVVIERAKHVLRQHEKQERQSVQVETAPEPMQMTIFTPLSQRIVDRIEAVDVNALTPLQALNLLEELQQELKEKIMSATIRQAAGSLLVVGLSGTELTALERAWLRLVRPGGVILFRRNIADAQQTRALLLEATGFGSAQGCALRGRRRRDGESAARCAGADCIGAGSGGSDALAKDRKGWGARIVCAGTKAWRLDRAGGEGVRI